MKKLAIGCGIALLLVLIVGSVATWWAVNKVKSTVAEFAELGKVPEIERNVANTTTFQPPDSRELTPEQVERYVRVQQQVREGLGVRFAELESKYKSLTDRREATVLDVPQLIAAYRDLAATYVAAKRTQVEALNGEGFSLDEYRWVRSQIYAALGVPVLDLDVAGFIEDLKAGRSPQEPRPMDIEPAPARNRELIEPHRELLQENTPLTFFGL